MQAVFKGYEYCVKQTMRYKHEMLVITAIGIIYILHIFQTTWKHLSYLSLCILCRDLFKRHHKNKRIKGKQHQAHNAHTCTNFHKLYPWQKNVKTHNSKTLNQVEFRKVSAYKSSLKWAFKEHHKDISALKLLFICKPSRTVTFRGR